MKPTPEDIIRALFDATEKGLRVVVTNASAPSGPVELGPASLAALEEVQVNVTGRDGIASETTLAALVALITPGTPQQRVGTVGVAAQTLTFTGPSKHVAVSNPTKNAVLEVSFNGGTSFIAFEGPSVLSVPCRVSSMQIRSTGGTIAYGVIATV